MAAKSGADWKAIEREYRLGQLSVREIARQCGVTEAGIRKTAKKHGWVRDLTGQVRAQVRSELVRDEVRTANAREPTDREAVQGAAARGVEVVRQHRTDIAAGRVMVGTLLGELRSATVNLEVIEAAIEAETADDENGKRRALMQMAVALPSRAKSMAALSVALKNLVGLERQAFNLDEPDREKDGDGDRGLSDSERAARIAALLDRGRARRT